MFDNPQQVLNAWLDGVNGGDLEGVLALYAEGSVLLPTFSDQILTDQSGKQSYFQRLAERGVSWVKVREESLVVQDLPLGVFSLAGIYDWKFEDGEQVEARFTYTVDVGLAAPITHHHSSALPKVGN